MVSVNVWVISCWRGLIGGILITAYVLWVGRRDKLSETVRLGWRGWLLATIGSASSLVFILSFKLTYVANVSIIYATAPFMAAALGWCIMRERMKPQTALAAVVCMLGVVVIANGNFSTASLAGDGVAILMTAGFALYMVLIRAFKGTPVVLAGAISALQLFVAGWFFADPLSVSPSDMSILVLFGISFAVAAVLLTEGTKLIPASEAGLLGAAETPFAVFFAWLFLMELPPAASFIGGALVLGAVLVHAAYDAWLIRADSDKSSESA
jgi:drug/metabolite transporter (DMT)-like permease